MMPKYRDSDAAHPTKAMRPSGTGPRGAPAVAVGGRAAHHAGRREYDTDEGLRPAAAGH
jgi:hypothetical protein